MKKNARYKILKGISLGLSMAVAALPTVSGATTFSTMTSSIFNSNSSEACTQCHHSSLVGSAARSSAPAGADFDIYSEAASRASTIDSFVSSGYMPMDPGAADFTDAADLNGTEMAIVADWLADGAPFAAATAVTDPATSITKTTANLRGDFDTNVYANTTVPGSYYFSWGLTTSYGNNTPSTARSSTLTTFNQSHSISGLACNTTYNFRARATNGNGTGSGSNRSFTTSACSAPVIRRNSSNAGVTESYTVGKGSSLNNAADFELDATDSDGTSALTWTLVGGQPAAGTASVSGTGATPTVTYSAPANVPAPDTVSFNVRVSDSSNGGVLTDTVTISIQIVDSPPTITNVSQPETITVTEDDGNGESVTLTATDPDGDTLTWSVVGGTEPTNGTLNTFATGGSQIVTYTPNANIDIDENFTVRVSDGAGTTDIVVNVNVIPLNDPPIAGDDLNFEVLVNSLNNILDVLANDTDVDTGDSKILPAQVIVGSSGGTITVVSPGNANNALSYTPVPGAIVAESFSYTMEDSAGSQSVAMVTVSPPDGDGDGVPNYSDNCAATANSGQEDNDGDGVKADNIATDPADPVVGGDICDDDDDNDGMPDVFENQFAFLDPFDSSDAAEDEDGDGLSNIDEFLGGTAPDVDSVAPIVIAPNDITVDATGLLTAVNFGMATGSDGNDGETTLFKVALNETVADCNALINLDNNIESFRPGNYTVTWVTCDISSNLGSDDQIVNVRPLVSMSSGQSIGEGQAVNVDVVLNGDAIAYPATVDYTLAGTAVAGVDHDGTAGTVTFAAKGDIGTISFNTASDAVVEDDETVTVTLSAPSNIALSNAITHTVTITETNVTPQVSLSVTQPAAVLDTNKGNTLYTTDGLATIIANATDGNGDALSYDWSATDASLFAAATITNAQFDFDPSALTVDAFYKVSVTVSDGQSVVTVDRLLLIKTMEINVWLIGQDDDGDGVDNLAEGYGDEDSDGIPNYLDNLLTPASAIENHTVNLETSVLIETNPGLHIALGETAIASGATGVLIGLQDIVDYGGSGGTAVTNAATDYTFLSSLLNFEVSGLTDSIVSINVVVPLQAAIQADVVVRKYNSTGWFDFVVDDLNEIRTAVGVSGTCPQPGSILYTVGLTPGHLCLQLTIQDGGANDADGARNFIVKDPAGLALAPEPEEEVDAESSGSSSGRLGSTNLWFILVFLMSVVYLWRRRKLQKIKTFK